MDTASAQPVALVAGASRGLGLLVARELAERGHRVVGLSRDPEALEGARDTMRGWGHEFTTHVADVIQVGPVESFDRSHYEQAIDTMLWGPINVTQAVLPAMRARRRGRLGVVTSIGGMISVPHLVPYSTAKFGAVGYTRGLNADLSGTGVTATTIVPGLMRTGSHVQATFVGDAPAEYAWFAPGAALPLISMDAERAAAAMVDATLKGKSIALISPLSKIGSRAYGLAPHTADLALGVMSRLLPSSKQDTGETVLGHDARARLSGAASTVVEKMTVLGNRASARFNENRRPCPAMETTHV